MAETIDNGKIDPNSWSPTDTNPTTGKSVQTGTKGVYTTLQYPMELGTARYPYYMMIFVNANSASALGQGQGGVQPLQGTGTNSATKTAQSRGVNQSATSAVQGSNGATAVNGVISMVASGIKIANTTDFIVSYKRLGLTVGLPMPHGISFGHSADYALASSGFLGTLLHDVSSEGFGQAGKDIVRGVVQGTLSTLAGTAGAAADKLVNGSGPGSESTTDMPAIIAKMQGIAKNERKEQVFKGMHVRTFNFQWTFIPKTLDESDIITNIIKWMKFNQYPEIDVNNGLNVIIPNEFDIEFHYTNPTSGVDAEIAGMSKITTCVLKDVIVNYTPLNKFIAFEGTDNPVAIELQMTFEELEPMNRSMIALGY
jgi:hypothetical protein